MIACLHGHCDIAELLLMKKASIDFQNSEGWSALMLACKGNHLQVAKLLLENGANVDLQDSKKWTNGWL